MFKANRGTTMNLDEAKKLVTSVGGEDAAISIVFDGIEPKECRFKWWDVETQGYALVSISDTSVYTPDLKKALVKLKYI